MASYLEAQFGFKAETTYGTAVTVDRFLPFLSESLSYEIEYMESNSYRTGRKTKTTRRPGQFRVAGDIEMELAPQGLGAWLKQALGTNVTAGAGPFTHTLTPGDLTGDSLTIQIGRTLSTGTMQPFTYAGCKITEWEISATVGEIAKMKASVYGSKAEVTGTALATASYPSGLLPFSFIDASVTIGGTATPVKSLTYTGTNGLLIDRQRLGSGESIEPIETGVREYGGTMEADFTSLVAYARYTGQTQAALVATFASGATSLVITSTVEFDGETVHASGMGNELVQNLPFTGIHATADSSVLSIVLTNADSVA